MAEITAALVKNLREKTGAGMMDCKKALVESDGDIEAAIDWLRTKGLSAAARIHAEDTSRLAVSRDTARQPAAIAGIFDFQLGAAPDQELLLFILGQPFDETDQKLKRGLGLIAVPRSEQDLAFRLIVPDALERAERQPGRQSGLGVSASD